MKKASKLFLGEHDFRTFMGRSPVNMDKDTRRHINRFDILESKPLTNSSYSWPNIGHTNIADYQFFDVYIESKSFLFRQVSFCYETSFIVIALQLSFFCL